MRRTPFDRIVQDALSCERLPGQGKISEDMRKVTERRRRFGSRRALILPGRKDMVKNDTTAAEQGIATTFRTVRDSSATDGI